MANPYAGAIEIIDELDPIIIDNKDPNDYLSQANDKTVSSVRATMRFVSKSGIQIADKNEFKNLNALAQQLDGYDKKILDLQYEYEDASKKLREILSNLKNAG